MFNKNILEFTEFYTKYRPLLKIVSLILATLTFFWLLLAIVINFINVEKTLKKSSPVSISYSSSSIEYFFIPKIVLTNFHLGDISANKAKIQISFLSLLTFSPKIDKLFLFNANSNNDLDGFYIITNHHKIFKNIIQRQDNILDIHFKNLTITALNKYLNFTDLVIKNTPNKLSVKGLTNENINIDFSLNKNDSKNALTLLLQNNTKEFSLEEHYSHNGDYQSGTMKFIALDKLGSSSGTNNIKAKVSITSDLELTDEAMSIKNIKCDGDSAQGTANIDLSNKVFNLVADFSTLDLNQFFDLETVKQILLGNEEKRKVPLGLDLGIQLRVNNLLLLDENINNLNVNIYNNNGKGLIVDNFSGTLDNNGLFKLTGLIEKNNYRSMFEGQISLAHNDFDKLLANLKIQPPTNNKPEAISLTSKLSLTAGELNADELNCSIGSTKINGRIGFRLIGENPRVNGALEVNNFDFGETLPLVKNTLNYFKQLVSDSNQPSYLNSFIPIRSNNILVNLDLTMSDITLYDQHYNKVDLLINTKPGIINLNLFSLSKPDFYLTGNASIDASNFQPIFKLNIVDGNIPPIYPDHLIDFKNLLQEKINLATLTAAVSIKMKDLEAFSTKLQNFGLNMHNNTNSSLILIDNLSFEALGGGAAANGSINQSPFLVNLGCAYNNINLSPIFQDSILMKNTTGVISTSGSINFSGDSLAEMLYSLNVKADLIGKNITIYNFGVDNLINKISQENYQQNNFADDLKNAANSGMTKFSDLKGSYKLNNGILSLENFAFTTDRSAGAASAILDIYRQNFDLSGLFNFYLGDQKQNISQFKLTIKDNIFNPQKVLEFNKNISDKLPN
jgi:hypothetical protein